MIGQKSSFPVAPADRERVHTCITAQAQIAITRKTAGTCPPLADTNERVLYVDDPLQKDEPL